MDKTKIKQLAKDSFINNEINPIKVQRISKLLDRSQLKEYIKAIKTIEKNNTIVLEVSDDKIGNVSAIGKQISKIYPGKKILIKTNPDLIAGMKIINNDLIYEVSLKQLLADAIDTI